MDRIEIRDYRGDFEDVAELARRTWAAVYQGKTWFPLWDATFLRWQLGGQDGAIGLAAYHRTRLVGAFFSAPHCLRVGSTALPVGIVSWLSIEPDRSGLALNLVEGLLQRHEERGFACSLGVVAGDVTSPAFRFWNRYARSRPGNFSFLFPFGIWVKPLAPDKVARAAIEPWVRRGNRVFGSLLRAIPPGNDPDVRVYRPEDLGACTRILEKATAGFDWALVWPAQRLAKQLESPVSRTLVVDRDGRVQGLVNYHFIMVHGREPVRAAIIDLWADDDLPAAQRARLLGHLCRELRARDVHMVTALRCAMMPAAAFAANFFLPIPRGFHMAALLARRGMSLPRPKRWSLLAR